MELPEWGFLEGDDARQFAVDADNRSTILGTGAYGLVYSATMHGLPVAAKTLHSLRDPEMYGLVGPHADPGAAERVRAEFDAEAKALAALRHPNVLGFFGVCYGRAAAGASSLPRWIVTERQPYSLHQFLRLPRLQAAMGIADVTFLVADVADGLSYLHSLGMVHRDLKPKNVLVGPGGAKVADLGTAKIIGIAAQTAQHTVGPGTAVYHPPEVLQGEYSAAIDVFSLGLLVVETALGESPQREGARDPVNMEQQRRALERYPSFERVVVGCLAMESRQRLKSDAVVQLLQDVISQPFFWEEAEQLAGGNGDEGADWADRSHGGALRRQLDGVTQGRRCREKLRLAEGEQERSRVAAEQASNSLTEQANVLEAALLEARAALQVHGCLVCPSFSGEGVCFWRVTRVRAIVMQGEQERMEDARREVERTTARRDESIAVYADTVAQLRLNMQVSMCVRQFSPIFPRKV